MVTQAMDRPPVDDDRAQSTITVIDADTHLTPDDRAKVPSLNAAKLYDIAI